MRDLQPQPEPISLTLSIRDRSAGSRRAFQRLIAVGPGFQREKIPVGEINGVVATTGVFEVELVPNEAEGLTLYFGLLDFVKEKAAVPAPSQTAAPAPAAKVKCVVWDLDHTLWRGILVEDGAEAIRLKDGVLEIITELDRRGILQSIASKNNHDDVMAVLQQLGIAEYFLQTQIHWRPKSASVAAIAESLNIGIDTLMFVDDQPFERQEVSSSWPQVRVLDARDLADIPGSPCTQVVVSEESRTRRLMYRQEEQRTALQHAYEGNYLSFLKESRHPRHVGVAQRIKPATGLRAGPAHQPDELLGQPLLPRAAPADHRRPVEGDVRPAVHRPLRGLWHRRLCAGRPPSSGGCSTSCSAAACRASGSSTHSSRWLLHGICRAIPGGASAANLRRTPEERAERRRLRRDGIRGALDTNNGLTTLTFARRPVDRPDDGVIDHRAGSQQ